MRNVLVLYHGQSMFTPTVRDYVESFAKYSRNNVMYLHANYDTDTTVNFDDYDVIILTYACRLCYLEIMSPCIRKKLKECRSLKVAFVQDEYQETNKVRSAIVELGLRLVFTCVPENKIAWVYPPEQLPGVRFVRVLTGYVPDRLRGIPRSDVPKIGERPFWVGYRGRNLGHCWGDLSYHKAEIGKRFKSACLRRGIPCNIEWSEQARIYQNRWFGFISSCRTTLATPSGLNIFDWDGKLEAEYKQLIAQDPDLRYEEYRPKIAAKEAEIDMGQVSPRIFEAAAMGTVVIALSGTYSDVLNPGVNCIEVKRDYSNVDDVLLQLSDVGHLQQIADRAQEQIILDDRWSYRNFVRKIDDEIEATVVADRKRSIADDGYFKDVKPADRIALERAALMSATQEPLSTCLDLSWLSSAVLGVEKTSKPANPSPNESSTVATTTVAELPSTPLADVFSPPKTSKKRFTAALVRRFRAVAPAPVKRYLKSLVISALTDT